MAGAAAPEAICAFAVSAGYGAVAITDTDNLYGLPVFVDAALEAGIKPLAGACLTLRGHVLLRIWCLNRVGFGRLCSILSARLQAGDSGSCAAMDELVADGWDGLVVASQLPDVLGRLAAASHAGSGGCWSKPFVEIPCTGGGMALSRLATGLNLPTIAVAGGRLFGVDDADRLGLLHAIDRRITLAALAGSTSWAGAGPGTPRAPLAAAACSAFPAAVAAAGRLAREAESAESFFASPPVFPAYRELDDAQSFGLLRRLCSEGARRRYMPQGVGRPDVRARLDRELAIIQSKGFAAYFLVVRDIVLACPRTCGRGSAASSIVSYLLGITHVDPLAHDLFFERFLNEGRCDPPDIDVDFPWDERPAILEQVFRDYAGRAAMVADHCCFSGASKVREAALAMGMALPEVDRLVALWRCNGPAALPEDLARAARLLAGLPRYIGTHPGGVVITPRPITWYSHVQHSPAGLPVLAWEKDGTERAGLVKIDLLGNRSLAVLRDCIALVNQSGMADRGAGIDTGLAAGQAVDQAAGQAVDQAADQAVDHATGQASGLATDPAGSSSLRWEDFDPLDDPLPRALIESGATIGIFYIESPATRQLLAKMRMADYEHLVAASSIIRPAANRYINEYVRRLHGGAWRMLTPAAEETLAGTYGIMVYQEDVSRVAMAAAGFDACEADGLRKALTKKRKGAAITAFRERFMSGCAVHGVSGRDAGELWDMMLSFDGYSFCKSHSASYALVSYRLAWMKAYHPGIFMVAVINNGGGFYGIQTYVDEARRLGYDILPPAVGESALAFVVSRERGPGRGSIRAGLACIAGLDAGTARSIVEQQARHGRYRGFRDFLDRVRPSMDDCRALVRAGALDGLGALDGNLTRPAMLWVYHHHRKNPARLGGELFGGWVPPSCIGDYPAHVKLSDEAAFLGALLSVVPAALFEDRARQLARDRGYPQPASSADLGRLLGRRIALVGIAAAGKDVQARDGRLMCFRSFADAAGMYEIVIFPKAYARLLPILEGNTAFLVMGVPCDDMGAIAVHVDDMVVLNRTALHRG
jgi:error-prone DNA polymerase